MEPKIEGPGDTWSVAVFAHNEADSIVDCLSSLRSAADDHPIDVYVLANGCTDRTEDVVRKYGRQHSEVHLVSIPKGDKANAWNVYVHQIAPPAAVHCFVDGDVVVSPGSFRALAQTLASATEANAAAGVPVNGWSRAEMVRIVVEWHDVLGLLYALRGSFVQRVRAEGVQMPVGFIGEDLLVSSLVKWDLEPRGPWVVARVAPCTAAQFRFTPISPLLPWQWRSYYQRHVRYGLRYFQHALLVPLLKARGCDGMPRTVEDLYAFPLATLRNRRRGIQRLFDAVALRRIKRTLNGRHGMFVTCD